MSKPNQMTLAELLKEIHRCGAISADKTAMPTKGYTATLMLEVMERFDNLRRFHRASTSAAPSFFYSSSQLCAMLEGRMRRLAEESAPRLDPEDVACASKALTDLTTTFRTMGDQTS